MTAPIPVDLIDRLERQGFNARRNGYQEIADSLEEAAKTLRQAQGRIGELEAIVRAVDPDWFSRGEPCGYPTCGCDADGACHIAIAQMEGETRGSLSAEARAQAAEGLLKEAGEVVAWMLESMLSAGVVHNGDVHEKDPIIPRARALLAKLSPGEGEA